MFKCSGARKMQRFLHNIRYYWTCLLWYGSNLVLCLSGTCLWMFQSNLPCSKYIIVSILLYPTLHISQTLFVSGKTIFFSSLKVLGALFKVHCALFLNTFSVSVVISEAQPEPILPFLLLCWSYTDNCIKMKWRTNQMKRWVRLIIFSAPTFRWATSSDLYFINKFSVSSTCLLNLDNWLCTYIVSIFNFNTIYQSCLCSCRVSHMIESNIEVRIQLFPFFLRLFSAAYKLH